MRTIAACACPPSTSSSRKQAEDRLKEQSETLARCEKELQALSTRLLSMEQEVRQHVARDLQDEFSQRITTLIVELSAL